MLRGQRTRADTTSDRPERQMNRNEMLHGTSSDGPGRQMNGNASWPTDKDNTSDRPGRQKNRNATWPAAKFATSDRPGRQTNRSDRPGRQMNREMLHGQRPRADTSSAGWETNEEKCYMASRKGRTPAVTDLGDK